MKLSRRFIAAGTDYCTLERSVNAPLLRKVFVLKEVPKESEVTVCGLGFYRLFVNGAEITKGHMAPYISNPDHIVYYDRYGLSGRLRAGKNVFALLLGNGFQNPMDNNLWDFQKARWRSAPKVALCFSADGEVVFEADESFVTHPSPITFDDERCGERYDARLSLPGWAEADFDDSGWTPAIPAETPRGISKLCTAEPVRVVKELAPVRILPAEGGYLYDFGENNAGVCRLKISGFAGQRVSLTHGEIAEGGKLNLSNIAFGDRSPAGNIQRDEYVLAGTGGETGVETYVPSFTYHGFRYVFAEGLEPEQAEGDTLTYLVLHSELMPAGEFYTDSETVNRIQECTLRSDLSNFVYFPTDCPQREKNGWTGDAALSAEQLLYNFKAASSLKEWLQCVRLAQTPEGQLPGIVPTAGWGYEWGCGPAWDAALVELPYRIYRMTGDTGALEDNAEAIFKYVRYMANKRGPEGLLAYGLGDWCEAGTTSEDGYATPLEVTDTAIGADIASKSAAVFTALGKTREAAFCETLKAELTASFRKKYVRKGVVSCPTQTAEAVALAYGMIPEEDEEAGYRELQRRIAEADGHFRVGVLGGRMLFDVLTAHGDTERALSMIVRPDFPSYAYPLARGATTLWEGFHELTDEPGTLRRVDGIPRMLSLNHHFWGFVSGWFYKALGGIWVCGAERVDVAPNFPKELNFVHASHEFPAGKLTVEWRRTPEGVLLTVASPAYLTGEVRLPAGYAFEGGGERRKLERKMRLVAVRR